MALSTVTSHLKYVPDYESEPLEITPTITEMTFDTVKKWWTYDYTVPGDSTQVKYVTFSILFRLNYLDNFAKTVLYIKPTTGLSRIISRSSSFRVVEKGDGQTIHEIPCVSLSFYGHVKGGTVLSQDLWSGCIDVGLEKPAVEQIDVYAWDIK